jgi:hypothetical protein
MPSDGMLAVLEYMLASGCGKFRIRGMVKLLMNRK